MLFHIPCQLLDALLGSLVHGTNDGTHFPLANTILATA